MTSLADVVDLKANVFGCFIFPLTFVVTAVMFLELRRGERICPLVPEDQKSPV